MLPQTHAERFAVSLTWMRDAPTLARSVRRQIEWAAEHAFSGVTIDATHPETRPRLLDRSARRDLAALLRRLELRCVGVDLWIPEEHFRRQDFIERAIDALDGACTLASDLSSLAGGSPLVHTTLPTNALPDATSAIAHSTQRTGVSLADYAWPATASHDPASLVGLGLDPATILAAGGDPVLAAVENASNLLAARLTDMSRSGPVRPGQGRLDVGAYVAAVRASLRSTPIILDLRAVPEPLAAGALFASQWTAG